MTMTPEDEKALAETLGELTPDEAYQRDGWPKAFYSGASVGVRATQRLLAESPLGAPAATPEDEKEAGMPRTICLAYGLISSLLCVRTGASDHDIENDVNTNMPTGIRSDWTVDGTVERKPCTEFPARRQHVAVHC